MGWSGLTLSIPRGDGLKPVQWLPNAENDPAVRYISGRSLPLVKNRLWEKPRKGFQNLSHGIRIICNILLITLKEAERRSSEMNIEPPDINNHMWSTDLLDRWSFRTIDQKFVMTPSPPCPPPFALLPPSPFLFCWCCIFCFVFYDFCLFCQK